MKNINIAYSQVTKRKAIGIKRKLAKHISNKYFNLPQGKTLLDGIKGIFTFLCIYAVILYVLDAREPQPEVFQHDTQLREEKIVEPKVEEIQIITAEVEQVVPVVESIPVAVPEVIPEPVAIPVVSIYKDKWFGAKTGNMHMERCNSTELGQRFVKEFKDRYGEDVAYIACAALNAENGHHNQYAIAACGLTSAQQCDYASANSAGMDAGLFMINTYYQAKRITKLGGPACEFTVDSRSISDPCNKLKIEWLHNLDNQMAIILDIYEEQGFTPWVAYLNQVQPYL